MLLFIYLIFYFVLNKLIVEDLKKIKKLQSVGKFFFPINVKSPKPYFHIFG